MIHIEGGDMLDVLARLKAEGVKVHSVVTDPPYHLQSIVKRFSNEKAKPSKDKKAGPYVRSSAGFMGKKWDGGDIAFRPETWRLCYDLLPPGGHLVAFSGTRTYHRMACAIEDSGFEIRDMLQWLYGSGFPKSHKVADGWGTALKPACEPIAFARKPIEGTNIANYAKHGTGALNIDGCRVAAKGRPLIEKENGRPDSAGKSVYGAGLSPPGRLAGATDLGRWPANVITDGSDEVVGAFPRSPGAQSGVTGIEKTANVFSGATSLGGFSGGRQGQAARGDAGSAARFFYSAKADADDRLGSKHPTVKPTDLMRWLVRLVTPPGGLVLDPFAGSGSTAMACLAEGFDCIVVEREEDSLADIRRRVAHVGGADTPLFSRES